MHRIKKGKKYQLINYENIPNAQQVAVSNLYQSVTIKAKLAKRYSDSQTVTCQ